MPLFNVAVREHTYTGQFYSDVVQAGSPEEALRVAAQHAVVPGPPRQAAARLRCRGARADLYRAAGYGRGTGLAPRGAGASGRARTAA